MNPRSHTGRRRMPAGAQGVLCFLSLVYGLFLASASVSADTTDSTPTDPAPTDSTPTEQARWPQFRGPRASGVSEGASLPEDWDVAGGKNVAWSVEVPGLAHSSPIIWGDRIVLTTALRLAGKQKLRLGLYGDIDPVDDEGAFRWVVRCLRREDGATLWERVAHEGKPKVRRHTKATHANSTPATDGARVVACFGSEGLYCYDLEGKLLWSKDLGVLDSGFFRVPAAQWGFASSPVLHEGKVVLQCDVQEDSFLAVFDAEDGSELWRVARDDVPTWSSPTVHAAGGRTQIIVNGYRHAGAYRFDDGSVIWKITDGGDIPVPTPVVAGGLVFLTSAHGRKAPIYAVRETATGDITPERGEEAEAAVAWHVERGGNYMQTPIVYRGLAYFCRDNGVLSCYESATGKLHYQTRLGGGGSGFTSSAVAGDGKLYFASEDGEVFIVRAGEEHALVATRPLGDQHMSTPAIAEGTLYFRTAGRLIAIRAPASGS